MAGSIALPCINTQVTQECVLMVSFRWLAKLIKHSRNGIYNEQYHNHNHLFSIPAIRQSGYRTCQ